MSSTMADLLRNATLELSGILSWIDTVSPDHPHAPGELQKLSERLQQVGERLGPASLALRSDGDQAAELAAYAETLERLMGSLERFRFALLARRRDLDSKRIYLEQAHSWSAGYRETMRS